MAIPRSDLQGPRTRSIFFCAKVLAGSYCVSRRRSQVRSISAGVLTMPRDGIVRIKQLEVAGAGIKFCKAQTQPLSLFQDEPQDHSLASDALLPVPAVASKCRRPTARARDRNLPRDGAVLMAQVRPKVYRRYPCQARRGDASPSTLAPAVSEEINETAWAAGSHRA